ncbi:MAG: hypothetical protein OEY36_03500 [Gammaproteobacteria bacterium]|nr:hypothetical protein [Gammaproteobacteria bacterium]
MKHSNPYCIGNYDFEKIAFYARKRFIEGYSMIDLFTQTTSHRERQEISLVSVMATDQHQIQKLELSCPYKEQCKVTDCVQRIKEIIEHNLH